MVSNRESESTTTRSLPILISLVGLLIAFLPPIYLPSYTGPAGLAFLMIEISGVITGLGVFSIGVYSYRTGNRRPAKATGLAIIGLVIMGITGGFIAILVVL